MVAMGMADLVVESALKPVDIAPLVPVIEGAGGIVTNWRGGSPLDGGQVIAAGSAEVHQRGSCLSVRRCGLRSALVF